MISMFRAVGKSLNFLQLFKLQAPNSVTILRVTLRYISSNNRFVWISRLPRCFGSWFVGGLGHDRMKVKNFLRILIN